MNAVCSAVFLGFSSLATFSNVSVWLQLPAEAVGCSCLSVLPAFLLVFDRALTLQMPYEVRGIVSRRVHPTAPNLQLSNAAHSMTRVLRQPTKTRPKIGVLFFPLHLPPSHCIRPQQQCCYSAILYIGLRPRASLPISIPPVRHVIGLIPIADPIIGATLPTCNTPATTLREGSIPQTH